MTEQDSSSIFHTAAIRRPGVRKTDMALNPAILMSVLLSLFASVSSAQLSEQNVLVLFNSMSPESQAVRDLYVERYPGVHEFDLNDPVAIGPERVTRPNYLSRIRTPLRDFINGDSAPFVDISGEVMAIVTTRGLPGIINRFATNDEFQVNATWTALESELVLLQQDLEQPGGGSLDFVFSGALDNPYHATIGQPITGFSRANVKTSATYNRVTFAPNIETWVSPDLTPGDLYLVTRLDALATDEGAPEEVTAIEHIERLLDRSADPAFTICSVQSLLDEYASPANELDDDGLGAVYPFFTDYENTAALMTAAGYDVLHDETANFVTGPELPDARPVLVLGTYGENHNQNGFGDPAPGSAVYIETFDLHPAAIFVSLESFNATSVWNPDSGRTNNQEQILDFITEGGSFAIGNVREPFTFPIADLEFLTRNMLLEGLTFAEAAYSCIPAISWMHVPLGDPLARMSVVDPAMPDRDRDGDVDIDDLYRHAANPVDLTCDQAINGDDTRVMQDAVRQNEPADVTTR